MQAEKANNIVVDLTTIIKAITHVVFEKSINEIVLHLYALDTVEEIKLAFGRNCNHVALSQERYLDIHAITCVLKLYLRQLPIPLATFDTYTQLLELRSSPIYVTTIMRLEKIECNKHFKFN